MFIAPLQQMELFEPEHLDPWNAHRRTPTAPETVYARHWHKLNDRRPSVNRGFTALEWICSNGQMPCAVSRRDAAVAAAVVQWLGTNCGLGFLWECERDIAEQRTMNEHPRTTFTARFVPRRSPRRALRVRGDML